MDKNTFKEIGIRSIYELKYMDNEINTVNEMEVTIDGGYSIIYEKEFEDGLKF